MQCKLTFTCTRKLTVSQFNHLAHGTKKIEKVVKELKQSRVCADETVTIRPELSMGLTHGLGLVGSRFFSFWLLLVGLGP